MQFEYQFKGKVTRVIDGDTYDITLDLGFDLSLNMHLRLRGVDTPEIHNTPHESDEYKAGMKAKARVQQLIEGKDVIVKTQKLTRTFERYVADLFFTGADGKDYNLADIIKQEDLIKKASYV